VMSTLLAHKFYVNVNQVVHIPEQPYIANNIMLKPHSIVGYWWKKFLKIFAN